MAKRNRSHSERGERNSRKPPDGVTRPRRSVDRSGNSAHNCSDSMSAIGKGSPQRFSGSNCETEPTCARAGEKHSQASNDSDIGPLWFGWATQNGFHMRRPFSAVPRRSPQQPDSIGGAEWIRTRGATRVYLSGIRPEFGALFGPNKSIDAVKRICSPGVRLYFGSLRFPSFRQTDARNPVTSEHATRVWSSNLSS